MQHACNFPWLLITALELSDLWWCVGIPEAIWSHLLGITLCVSIFEIQSAKLSPIKSFGFGLKKISLTKLEIKFLTESSGMDLIYSVIFLPFVLSELENEPLPLGDTGSFFSMACSPQSSFPDQVAKTESGFSACSSPILGTRQE